MYWQRIHVLAEDTCNGRGYMYWHCQDLDTVAKEKGSSLLLQHETIVYTESIKILHITISVETKARSMPRSPAMPMRHAMSNAARRVGKSRPLHCLWPCSSVREGIYIEAAQRLPRPPGKPGVVHIYNRNVSACSSLHSRIPRLEGTCETFEQIVKFLPIRRVVGKPAMLA